MKPPETYTEFTCMRKKVCSKFLAAKTCIFNNDCDGGTHPAELDPTKKPEEPNPVSTEISIKSFFGCERCIDKGIKCNKLARDPTGKEPCSECRQFAGADDDPCDLWGPELPYGHDYPVYHGMEIRSQRDEDFEELDIASM